jgi:hypothetical protein
MTQKRTVLLIVSMMFVSYLSYSQTQPCPSGTLANVMGTSCTIGNVTFTFGTNFSGFHQTNDTGTNLVTTFFGPDAIGFVPVQSGNQTGFALNPNFVADASSMFLDFFDASFSYGLKVNGDFEIDSETASIQASITQSSTENVNSFDAHCFTNQRCIEVAPTLNFVPGFGSNNTPSVTEVSPIPGLEADLSNPFGLSFTTNLTSFAFNPGEAVLSSAVFLYTVNPQTPLPPLAKLSYQNIDLPGSLLTLVEGLNDHGDLVGVFRDTTGIVHGYLSNADGIQTLAFPNALSTQAFDINNPGDIVGSYIDAHRVRHGFLLQNGVFSSIDFPGAILTIATGINDHGDIAGFYNAANRRTHGFVLDDNGFRTVDDPAQSPLILNEVIGINDRDDLTGLFLDDQGTEHGFLFSQNAFQTIGVPGGFQAFAEGLNDHDNLVGGYVDLHAFAHGFLNDGASFRTVDFPGANATTPVGVNNRGQIVGQYLDSARKAHSFLAQKQDDGSPDKAPDDTSNQPVVTTPCSEQDRIENGVNIKNPASCDTDN